MASKAFKFFMRPTPAQRVELQRTLDTCRELYNAALEEKREAYRRAGITRSCAAQQADLTEIKAARPDVARVYAQVLQDVFKRLHRAFDGFFRRCNAGATPGYPRFKGRDHYDSFTFPQVARKGALKSGGVDLTSRGRLKVHGIPGELKVIWHRAMVGRIKTATLKREGERWYVVFACDEIPREDRVHTGSTCGLDVGLASFAVLDDGTAFANPRYLRAAEQKLVAAQRTVSRRKRGSKRRRNARELLAKRHARVANARCDHAHKLARRLVQTHDRIAVESLNVAGMARGFLSKSVHDAGWSQFLSILVSKAANAGCEVVQVNASGTSQVCSECGVVVRKDLSVRVHRCPACGLVLDRDQNAARNIRVRAFGREAAVGEGRLRPDEPRSLGL